MVTGIEDKSVTSVVIPDTYNGVPVVGATLEDCTQLTSIVLGRNVFVLHVLRQCSSLTSITVAKGNPYYYSVRNCVIMPKNKTLVGGCKTSVIPTDGSVTSIGIGAFLNCSGLTSIIIPNSVTSIGQAAFADCSGLTSITIPNSVTSIGPYAFADCSGLTSITIPNSVTSIRYNTFDGCSSLMSITIPNSVTSIGEQAFNGCSNLTRIDYQGTKAQWNAISKESFRWDYNTGNYTVYCTDGTIQKGE
ncbi:MAG: leucine-rich repeat domain-containing protein [Clostridiales bacterium]|nr:leucine-rich repeat domain-containing protein [Clostridiales bacterium]